MEVLDPLLEVRQPVGIHLQPLHEIDGELGHPGIVFGIVLPEKLVHKDQPLQAPGLQVFRVLGVNWIVQVVGVGAVTVGLDGAACGQQPVLWNRCRCPWQCPFVVRVCSTSMKLVIFETTSAGPIPN